MPCFAGSAVDRRGILDNGFMKTNRIREWFRSIRVPRGVIIAVCVLPAVLTALFYALRWLPSVMDWAATFVSAPIRGFLGMLSAFYPFSMTEVLITVVIIWLIYYVAKTISVNSRRRGKWKILGKRLLPVLVAALYFWSMFCWLWNSGYHAPGFASKNGFSGEGVSVADLTAVTRLFAEKANELSLEVERDREGRYSENRRQMFDDSTEIFNGIASEFPSLETRLFRPKPMAFSWLMSRTGYSGMYFALTGETNINTRPPGAMMPMTVAHEHAHHLGIFAEDEANFVAILACITSGNTAFEYAGYLSGLAHLLNALFPEDIQAWIEISDSFTDELIRDWQANSDFWRSQREVSIGVDFIDNILTSVVVTVSDTVDTIYDEFLKSQSQELGINSYGAFIDLLVEYCVTRGKISG